MITTRLARPGDGTLILRTTLALAECHGVEHTVTASAADFEAALFGGNAVIGAAVAEADGELAGAAVWHRSFSTNRGREVMYLEDISVLPGFRRKGVGMALMRKVAAVALERGYPSIFWFMMDWNQPGRQFYQRLGAEIESGTSYCRIHGEALRALVQ
jgi:GNAT superfamily N-acetyltransferase